MFWKSVVCRGNKFFFFQISLLIRVDCLSPASCFAQTSSWFNALHVVVRLCAYIVSLNLNSCPHSLLGVFVGFFFARQFQRWCIFQEPIVTPDGLGTVGMFTFESCVSGHALSLHFYRPGCSGLFRLMSLALFVSPAPPSLAPPLVKGWCSLGRP